MDQDFVGLLPELGRHRPYPALGREEAVLTELGCEEFAVLGNHGRFAPSVMNGHKTHSSQQVKADLKI